MKSIQKEQILRVNCPGFGEENYFTVGRAKPLDAYKVIVVNPISVFHLFDKDLAMQKEIDAKLTEGLTNLTIDNDTILQSIQDDLKSKRILELVSFLEKGGLLIYYLCRPFLVQGDNIAIDNYSWLESLAPDSSPDDNIRHMSAVSHGRIVEPTEHTEESGFAKYFAQSGLEWNTIIRTDFLTEGYIALATAGPRKCIAGQLVAGDQGGRIVFLPSPYSPDFDKNLVDCINIWYNHGDTSSPKAVQDAAPVATAATPAPAPSAAAAAPTPAPTPAPVSTAPASVAAAATATAAAPSSAAAGAQPTESQPPAAKGSTTAAGAPAQPNSPRTSSTEVTPVAQPASSRTSTTSANAISQPGSPRTSATNTPSVTPPVVGTTSGGSIERVPSQFTSAASHSRLPAAKAPESQATSSSAVTSTTLPSMQQGSLVEPPLPKEALTAQVTAEFDGQAVRDFLSGDESSSAARKKGAEMSETTTEKPTSDVKPSAVDILKELEALSMGEPPAATAEVISRPEVKSAEPAAALNRNLFEELETLAHTVPSEKPPEKRPSETETAPIAEANPAAVSKPSQSQTPIAPEIKELNAQLNQMAKSLAAQADAKRSTETGKTEASEPAVSPAAAEEVITAKTSSVNEEEPIREATTLPETAAQAKIEENSFKPERSFDASFQFDSDFTFSDLEKEFSATPAKTPENHKEEALEVPPTPEAKDLIKKMEEISKTMATADWSVDIAFPDVEELKKERNALTESIKQAQTKIASIDNKIAQLESLKNALLGAEGENTANACVRVFNRLGWNANPSGKNADEYHLSGGGATDFIAKVVKSTTQAQRSDLSSLASSVVEFWDKNEVEPKGILVACTWTTKPPSQRSEADFAEGLTEFAQKKGLCLMTTTQLLCIYRDIEMGKQSTEEIRKRVEETNGRLAGFQLATPMAKV